VRHVITTGRNYSPWIIDRNYQRSGREIVSAFDFGGRFVWKESPIGPRYWLGGSYQEPVNFDSDIFAEDDAKSFRFEAVKSRVLAAQNSTFSASGTNMNRRQTLFRPALSINSSIRGK
jgi:hypothetical protein